jgi:hypothetical protein
MTVPVMRLLSVCMRYHSSDGAGLDHYHKMHDAAVQSVHVVKC